MDSLLAQMADDQSKVFETRGNIKANSDEKRDFHNKNEQHLRSCYDVHDVAYFVIRGLHYVDVR